MASCTASETATGSSTATIGTNRDEFVDVRKMAIVDWLDRPAAAE
jgi:hypothetical protein